MYVLEGEVRFKLGDEIQTAPTGSYVFIPRGTPHAWQNVGDGPARMLFHFTPSGMERFFDGFAALEAPGPKAFEEVGAEVGVDVVGLPNSHNQIPSNAPAWLGSDRGAGCRRGGGRSSIRRLRGDRRGWRAP